MIDIFLSIQPVGNDIFLSDPTTNRTVQAATRRKFGGASDGDSIDNFTKALFRRRRQEDELIGVLVTSFLTTQH